VVIVEASIATLNVAATILVQKAHTVAVFNGSVELTAGGVTTAAAPVVKLHT